MNKAFEKILERLEEYIKDYSDLDLLDFFRGKVDALKQARRIVQEVAEEYNGGWIPCSERLPADDDICIVTVEYPNSETLVQYGWFDKNGVCWYVGMQEFRTSNVLAWQPLPEPYKERE